MAIVLLGLLLSLTFKHASQLTFSKTSIFILAVSIIPLAQYVFGKIYFFGTAIIGFAYVFGFFLCVLLGEFSERVKKNYVLDIVFAAFIIGSVASVGLQLQQWLGLEINPMVNMGGGGGRPYANLGQPNQLGTLLLIGITAVAWFRHRKVLGAYPSFLLIVLIVFGMVLTQSRTALVGLLILTVFTHRSLHLINHICLRRVFLIASVAYIVVFALFYIGPKLIISDGSYNSIYSRIESSIDISSSSTHRLAIWKASVLAITKEPLLGFGWNQSLSAHLSVLKEEFKDNGIIYYSHNIFLDVLIWCGLPLGLFIIITSAIWFYGRYKSGLSEGRAFALCGIIPFLNHSLLEQPYAYAYILLPVGVLTGVYFFDDKSASCNNNVKKHYATALLTGAISLTIGLFHDMAKINEEYQRLLYKEMNIIAAPPSTPNVFFLDQWQSYIGLIIENDQHLTTADRERELRKLTETIATPAAYWKLAKIYVLMNKRDEYEKTLLTMCNIFPTRVCNAVSKVRFEN